MLSVSAATSQNPSPTARSNNAPRLSHPQGSPWTEWEYMEHRQAAESEEHRPNMSMAQALANKLKISLEDAEPLADAEVTANTSDDGMIYSYWVDVEPYAEGALRADLLARFGTLEFELDVNFFDDIHPDM